MKAIVISALVFFSLRAMSAVNEDKKGDCIYSPQSSRTLQPKIVEPVIAQDAKSQTKAAGK